MAKITIDLGEWAGLDLTRLKQQIAKVPVSKRRQLLEFIKYNKILTFVPEHWQKEFFDNGKEHTQRAVTAGNRCGKSYGIAFEIALHLTGLYDKFPWWNGVVYKRPPVIWAVGYSLEQIHQAECLVDLITGKREEGTWGTGFIPRTHLPDLDDVAWEARNKGWLKQLKVKHVSGGISALEFKTYGAGQHSYMGAMPDLIAVDEEPKDQSIWGQLVARIVKKKSGRITLTATPEVGYTPLIKEFFEGQYADSLTRVTVWDCSHISTEDIQRMIDTYPPREHDLRMKGIPGIGSGAVYLAEPEKITYEDGYQIPEHFKRLCAVDFGWNHPAAIVWVAVDPDTNKYFVYDCWKGKETTLSEMANIIKGRGNVPTIYPHDGANSTQAAGGDTMADQLREYGVNISRRFTNPPDINGSENNHVTPGLNHIRHAMAEDRFFVKRTLVDWFGEYHTYQYDSNGKIRKVDDDIQDATRYAIMSVDRFGVTGGHKQDSLAFKNRLNKKLRSKQR